MGQDDIQGSHTKHYGNANFLCRAQLDPPKLRQGNGQHPEVDADAKGGVRPRNGVAVHAMARVFAVPLGPEVGDGMALEDGQADEEHADTDDECYCRPENQTNVSVWEYAEVEEK